MHMEQIRVNGSQPYDLWFGRGAFGQLTEQLPARCPDIRSACLICDETVAALYAEPAEQVLRGLGYAVSRFSFPDTVDPRTLEIYEKLIIHLQDTGMQSNGILVAMGGTRVQRLAGFAAGTFGDGLMWVAAPTTLSGMIEPRCGERYGLRIGKTKDAIGVVKPPVLAVCDTEYLDTLPDAQVRSGYAHVVRYSVMGFSPVTKSLPKIRDLKIPEAGCSAELPSEETLLASVRTAAETACNAFSDYAGELATAIEEASAFEISRGYALASAMGVLAQLSVKAGYCDRKRYRYLATRLMQFGLPTGTSLSWDEIRDRLPSTTVEATTVEQDKDNADAQTVSCVVLKDVGCAAVTMTAEEYERNMRGAFATCRTVCAGLVNPEELYLPYSKELVIRMALAWFLDGFSLLDLSEMPGDDIKAMGSSLRELLTVENLALPCGESATVLRLLLPLIGVIDLDDVHFSLGAGLYLRPHEDFLQVLREHGMTITTDDGKREFVASGRLSPGAYSITNRNAAEQVCGLLFTLPLLHGDSTILIPDNMYRKNLIHMTVNILHMAGVEVNTTDYGYFVRGEQHYNRFGLRDLTPERDWSLAAMFETLTYITGETVPMADMPTASLQGERIITDFLEQLRQAAEEGETEVRIDMGNVPNLIPCVALAASLTDGVTTTLTGLEVLSDREGNRLQSIAMVLATLGADIVISRLPEEETDIYIIRGRECLGGGIVDSMGDHRIAMMAAIAAWGCEQPVTVTDTEVVERSFPGFFDEIDRLAGKID